MCLREKWGTLRKTRAVPLATLSVFDHEACSAACSVLKMETTRRNVTKDANTTRSPMRGVTSGAKSRIKELVRASRYFKMAAPMREKVHSC